MCLPHDPMSFIAWLETQECVLRAWRDELVFSETLDAGRISDIERHCDFLAAEAQRLKADFGFCEPGETARLTVGAR